MAFTQGSALLKGRHDHASGANLLCSKLPRSLLRPNFLAKICVALVAPTQACRRMMRRVAQTVLDSQSLTSSGIAGTKSLLASVLSHIYPRCFKKCEFGSCGFGSAVALVVELFMVTGGFRLRRRVLMTGDKVSATMAFRRRKF